MLPQHCHMNNSLYLSMARGVICRYSVRHQFRFQSRQAQDSKTIGFRDIASQN